MNVNSCRPNLTILVSAGEITKKGQKNKPEDRP